MIHMKRRNRRTVPIVLGATYNQLTIVKDLGMVSAGGEKARRRCVAKCSCGTVITARLDQIKGSNTTSCGCAFKAFLVSGKARRSHGRSLSRFYRIWAGMVDRAKHHREKPYKDVYVHSDWRVFSNFSRDMLNSYEKHVAEHGERNTTIDRIDPFGNYEKQNCRWATYKQQANNKRKLWNKTICESL